VQVGMEKRLSRAETKNEKKESTSFGRGERPYTSSKKPTRESLLPERERGKKEEFSFRRDLSPSSRKKKGLLERMCRITFRDGKRKGKEKGGKSNRILLAENVHKNPQSLREAGTLCFSRPEGRGKKKGEKEGPSLRSSLEKREFS